MKHVFLIIVLMFAAMVNAQNITTFAGTGVSSYSGEGVAALVAGVPNPGNGVFDRNGNFYFPDAQNSQRLRKVDVNGNIFSVAGNGIGGFAGDNGPASAAVLKGPSSVAMDSAGNLFIADAQNFRIRKINASTNIITTIAGVGIGGYSGDNGPATNAMFWAIPDICSDKWGNLYIADQTNARIRKIDTAGTITTYAGNGTPGFSGDDGPATAAQLSTPAGVEMDRDGNLYIADPSSFSCRVRKVSASGIITTIAGNGMSNFNVDGIPATAAQIVPSRLALDAAGNLFVSDGYNERVYRIDLLSGIIYTVAGNGIAGDTGDAGPATSATLYTPAGVAVDLCGSLYISTVGNIAVAGSGRRIRKVTYPPILTTPTITLNSSTSSASLGSSVTINATVSNAGSSYIIHWLNKGVEFTTTTVPSVTYTKAAGTDTITARVVSTATYGCYDSTTSSGWVVTASAMATSGLAEGAEVLRMWPIPTKDVLHIDDVSVVSSYRVVSMVGAMLLQGQLKAGSNTIDVRDLPAGMYMVEITGNDGKRTVKKIIRQ